MATTYLTITGVADVAPGPLSLDEAAALVERGGGPVGVDWWRSWSRRDSFRDVVQRLLDLVPDPEPLHLLQHDGATAIGPDAALRLRDALDALLDEVRRHPEVLPPRSYWPEHTPEDVLQALDRSATGYQHDVDGTEDSTSVEVLGSVLGHLRQQAAAADAAARSGRSLVTFTVA